MAGGGARAGAGTKKGSKRKSTILKEARAADIQEKVFAQGITPLEVITQTMLYLFGLASEETDKSTKINLMRQASEEAQACANYLHPKLSSVENAIKPGSGLKKFTLTLEAESDDDGDA